MSFLVRAPGKLFLLGEYAVLDGAAALVAAVDRGVACRASPGEGLRTPGDDRFVRAALAAARAPAGWRFVFEDWNPTGLTPKPGLGGSAAATVAAVAAALHAAGRPLGEVEALAVAAHRAVQGSGSGMDVRASARGGLRWHRPDAPPGPPLPLPGALMAVWSGRSASTGPRVARYLAWPDRDAFVAEAMALPGLFDVDPAAAIRAAYAGLKAMAARAGLDYDTPALARVAALAEARGGAAKPSGAGGGDIAAALLPDPDAARSFAQACAAEGLTPIPVAIADGVGVLELPHA